MSGGNFQNHSRCKTEGIDGDDSRDILEYVDTVIHGKQDPAWWMEEILGVQLFPAQKEILYEFYRNRYNPSLEQLKRLTVVAGMRSGKTALASMMGCYELWDLLTMTNPKPAEYYRLLRNQKIFIMIVATSEKQADDGVYSNIQSMLEVSDWFNTWTDIVVRSDSIESATQRVKLQIMSSWANTGVGRTAKCVIFDELANFENTTGKRGAEEVYSRLGKATDTLGTDGHVIAISSPLHPTDIMMRLYRESFDDPTHLGIMKPTWEMNPHLTEAALREEHKHNISAFLRDYACQPAAAGGVPFPNGVVLNKNIENVLHKVVLDPLYKPAVNPIRVLSLDPAVKRDMFGMACGYMDPRGIPVIDGAIGFRSPGKDAIISSALMWEYVKRCIINLNCIVIVHDTWMFPELIEKAWTEFHIPNEKHIVKKPDYMRWVELQENQQVVVVHDDTLKHEVENLHIVSENRIDHPVIGSKDIADAVCNDIWYLKEMLPQVAPVALKPVVLTY